MLAPAPGARRKAVLFEHIEHGQTRSAGHGVAAEGAEELHAVVEGGRDLASGDDGAEREAVADRLAEHEDVRHHALRLEPPEVRTHPAEARLDLVGDAQASR